ncbi:hypothetical protein RB595_010085 [Gaeumannomyces hyphopodioides]
MPVLLLPLKEGTLADLIGHTLDNPQLEPGLQDLADIVCHQMLRALAFLAVREVAHRNLKPENIFFVSVPEPHRQQQQQQGSVSYHFRLTDFGCSKRWSDALQDEDDKVAGTPCFVAPERI